MRFPPGKSKGFGYCDFQDRESLVEALNLNEEMIRNRKIRIDLADQHQSKMATKLWGKKTGHSVEFARLREASR